MSNKNKNDKSEMTDKQRLEAMLAKVQEENASLRATNAKLRQNARPDGALSLTGNLTFPGGTRKDLIGGVAKQTIKLPGGLGVIQLVGEWKQSGSGNCTARLTGWVDPSKLTLKGKEASSDAEAKTGQTFEQVVDAK